jgi:hypothetical protein
MKGVEMFEVWGMIEVWGTNYIYQPILTYLSSRSFRAFVMHQVAVSISWCFALSPIYAVEIGSTLTTF